MKKIRSALVSVYHKEGLAPIVEALHANDVQLYSTGGTYEYIQKQGIPVQLVENVTGYPSILDGRVKTLHPKVFGGILARREPEHLEELEQYRIPEIDSVIVDLYPFEQTLAETDDEATLIEKIDIGGISLIRAAAKNYNDVVIVPSRDNYAEFLQILEEQGNATSLEQRRHFARCAFAISSHYDTVIHSYFQADAPTSSFKQSIKQQQVLRYGENPHQEGVFYGDLSELLEKLNGKALSYNNLVDIDAAVEVMCEFEKAAPTFAVLKHTNTCGLATRDSLLQAWKDALAGDPISAFGGILICNTELDLATAKEINELFYEVLIAPSFSEEALELLKKKKKRVLLQLKSFTRPTKRFKSLLNGVIQQDADLKMETAEDLKAVTKKAPSEAEIQDLLFANKCAKHLKSNTIVLAKNQQLIGMGCGQTSRVDALKQAITKARALGFELKGAVMASDAFFPFPDCVEIADAEGITAVIQPGGSIKDQLSIDYCDAHDMSMVMTGTRHFKH